MKVTTEVLERCETLVIVEVDAKKEQNMLKKAAKRIAREVKIPGFRPGKAPYNVVVRRFGPEAVQKEALEQSVDKIIQDAIQDADIVPYARISLDGIEWNPLTVKVKVPTRPEVELGEYRDIRIESEPVEVTDEDVEETLKNIQDRNAVWNPVERAAEIGDLVTMDVVEKDGEDVLSKREAVDQELGDPAGHEGHDHPDMTTPLLGLSAGDEKIFAVDYPEAFEDERYAGKEITLEVKINSVKEKEVDPLDDEFAKSFSDFDTLAEFKEDILKNLKNQRQREQNRQLGNEAIDKIVENGTIVWPQAFEDESIDQEVKRVQRQMESYGLSIENYFQMQGITEEDYKEQVREQVVNQLKRSLALGKIVTLEKLEVGESEILERAKMIADFSGGGEQLWRNIMASQPQRARVAEELIVDKALDQLAAIVKGEDFPPGSAVEADQEEEEAGEETVIAEAVKVEAAAEEAVEAEAESIAGASETDQVDESKSTSGEDSAPEEEEEN